MSQFALNVPVESLWLADLFGIAEFLEDEPERTGTFVSRISIKEDSGVTLEEAAETTVQTLRNKFLTFNRNIAVEPIKLVVATSTEGDLWMRVSIQDEASPAETGSSPPSDA